MTKFEFQAIGTKWVIDINQKLEDGKKAELFKKINDRVVEFDLAYSRFRLDSLVTLMSQKSGDYILPPDADEMISLYKKMYDVTGGLVTPLIAQVLVDAGYDANYSLIQKPLTKPLPWDKVLKWQNPKLTLVSPALLDFGAGGKGYLVDIVSEILKENGIDSYCVDAGGDMRYRSFENKKFCIGLEHPSDLIQDIENALKQLNTPQLE